MVKCLNCGACCYLEHKDGTTTDIPCPYLLFMPNGLTACKVYNRNRIGRVMNLRSELRAELIRITEPVIRRGEEYQPWGNIFSRFWRHAGPPEIPHKNSVTQNQMFGFYSF